MKIHFFNLISDTINMDLIIDQKSYRKIPLILLGRISGKRTNLMGLYSGALAYIRGMLNSGGKTLQFEIC